MLFSFDRTNNEDIICIYLSIIARRFWRDRGSSIQVRSFGHTAGTARVQKFPSPPQRARLLLPSPSSAARMPPPPKGEARAAAVRSAPWLPLWGSWLAAGQTERASPPAGGQGGSWCPLSCGCFFDVSGRVCASFTLFPKGSPLPGSERPPAAG